MNNLYYQTCIGTGNIVKDNGIMPCNFNQTVDESKKEFSIYIYGDAINPKNAKNPLFLCRNLISYLHCHFLGKERDSKKLLIYILHVILLKIL